MARLYHWMNLAAIAFLDEAHWSRASDRGGWFGIGMNTGSCIEKKS